MMARGTISAIALAMLVILLGAYGLQYHTWGVSIQVVPLTKSIETDTLSAGVDISGSENYGTHPTEATAAVPASDNTTGENATVILQDNSIVHFMVTDEDAGILDNYFENLTINICVYERGLVNATPHDNLNLHVVVNGVGQTNIDNSTTVLNADNAWDPVITLDYTTGGSAATGNITVNVCAKEAGTNSGFGGASYKWTVPYEIS